MIETETVESMEDALKQCGITETTLTREEKDALDRDGYLVLADIIIAISGSVLVFNGHLWHSGARNETNLQQRVLQCVFVARGLSTLPTSSTMLSNG